MTNFEDIIFRWRYAIGTLLVLLICAGSVLILWQKSTMNRKADNNQVVELQKQNELLRSRLSGQAQVAGARTQVTSQNQNDKININTADLAALDKIPNVGPVTAQRIIDYRSQNGNFETIEEMKNVKGIGDKTFEKLKDSITVGG